MGFLFFKHGVRKLSGSFYCNLLLWCKLLGGGAGVTISTYLCGAKQTYSCKVKLTAISPIHWNKVYLTAIRYNLTVVRYTLFSNKVYLTGISYTILL